MDSIRSSRELKKEMFSELRSIQIVKADLEQPNQNPMRSHSQDWQLSLGDLVLHRLGQMSQIPAILL